jgi:hypothetical protein
MFGRAALASADTYVTSFVEMSHDQPHSAFNNASSLHTTTSNSIDINMQDLPPVGGHNSCLETEDDQIKDLVLEEAQKKAEEHRNSKSNLCGPNSR